MARSILISLLLFVLAGAAFFILRPASPEREIAVLSRQLTHPVGKLHKLHAALWTRLPQFVRDNTSSFAPANPQLLQLAAVETLHARAPQSPQAVAALVSALDDRTLAPHAIAALCAIGPCAGDSVAKLAEMAGRAGATPPNFGDNALRALGTIAPNDHRFISVLFSKARQNDFQSLIAFSVMEQCAPYYDETARDKLFALAAENIALRQPVLRIAARVQPQSARTGALLLDLLRDPEPGLKLVAVEVLAERSSPVFQAEILAQIDGILTAFENDLIEEPARVPYTASWLSPTPSIRFRQPGGAFHLCSRADRFVRCSRNSGSPAAPVASLPSRAVRGSSGALSHRGPVQPPSRNPPGGSLRWAPADPLRGRAAPMPACSRVAAGHRAPAPSRAERSRQTYSARRGSSLAGTGAQSRRSTARSSPTPLRSLARRARPSDRRHRPDSRQNPVAAVLAYVERFSHEEENFGPAQ